MPRGKKIDLKLKEQILKEYDQGVSVETLSKNHGVKTATIYAWQKKIKKTDSIPKKTPPSNLSWIEVLKNQIKENETQLSLYKEKSSKLETILARDKKILEEVEPEK